LDKFISQIHTVRSIHQVKEGLSIHEVIDLYHFNQFKPLTGPTHTVEQAQVSRMIN
jgi:hypothetical protein